MSRSIEFLSRFCDEKRLDKKTLIVSSYQIGHQIGEAPAKEGGSWVNLHFAGLPRLARETAALELSTKEIELISQAKALFLIDQVFRRLKASKKLKYFGRVEATAGIIRALRHSIFALRMAGWRSRDLKPGRFIADVKGEEIILILGEYEDELEKNKLTDLPGLYVLALQEAKKAPKKGPAGKRNFIFIFLVGDPKQSIYRFRRADIDIYNLFKKIVEEGGGEVLRLTPARENAVRLMNLHKAKGLEAPVVFLANPVGIKDHEVDKHIVRVGTFPKGTFPKGTPCDGRPAGYFAFCRPGTYRKKGPVLSQPVGWEEAAAEEEKYEALADVPEPKISPLPLAGEDWGEGQLSPITRQT